MVIAFIWPAVGQVPPAFRIEYSFSARAPSIPLLCFESVKHLSIWTAYRQNLAIRIWSRGVASDPGVVRDLIMLSLVYHCGIMVFT
jgi:hypothetical protein